ncbi:MAG: GntR family transcriptional regulator, partial [Pseudomonas laurylsulfatiphila]
LARDAPRASTMMRTHLMTPVPIIAEIMLVQGMGSAA